MATTDLILYKNCPSKDSSSKVEVELTSPELSFTIDGTYIGHNHATHLDCVIGSTSHQRAHDIDLAVPTGKMMVVIQWRLDVMEQIVTVPNRYRVQNDQPNYHQSQGRTEVIFEVPPHDQDSRTWIISDGTPGFELTVKVKRK